MLNVSTTSADVALHHGSLSAEQRAGSRRRWRAARCGPYSARLGAVDLGIDWGDVDQVIQLASPASASRMVQRIGRANHRLDEPSQALFVPANRFEMLECQAAREDGSPRSRSTPSQSGRARSTCWPSIVMGLGLLRAGSTCCGSGTTRSAPQARIATSTWEDFRRAVDRFPVSTRAAAR